MLRALAGCAVAACTVLTLTAAPTLAESRTLDDGTGDVWTQDGDSGDLVLAGARDNVDLTSTVVNHRHNSIAATATYTDLVRNTDTVEFAILFKRPDNKKFWVVVFAGPGDRNGSIRVQKSNGDNLRCAGKSKAVDYDAETITLSVPRSCLGKPRWVKHQSAGIAYEDINDPFQGFYIDDSASDQGEPSTWSAQLARG